MNSRKVKALLLKRIKYGESDLVVTGLTQEGEKIVALARGAMKSKKRFGGGVLEPTHYVELVLRASSRAEGMATLEEARLLESFEGLRSTYERLEAALALVDLVDRVSLDGDTDSRSLFDLLGHALRALQRGANEHRIRVQFCLKLLYQQGVLEPEAWMGSFLKNPLTELKDETFPRLQSIQQRWVQEQVEIYTRTAERH